MSLETGVDREILQRAGALATELAYKAGALLRDAISMERRITHKGEVDLVTDADEASETLIVEGIREAFPDHRLVGEEGATGAEDSDYGWVIDPLDGTTNFAHGYPHFAVSIGLEFLGEPVLGVVYDPMRDEMFSGVTGEGATLNGEPIRVSSVETLMQAMLATGFSYDISERGPAYALWTAFNDQTQAVRRDGAAALDMTWVACGRLDGFFEKPVNSWDVGAGIVIAREAGATVTMMDGSPHELYGREVCCTNGVLHDRVVQLITKTTGGSL